LAIEALGHYKILDRIGTGGIGDVYRARDTRLGRTVAIKVASDDIVGDSARRDAFLRDARAAAALSHPNIAALYEAGEDDGRVFLALEFVPGDTLTQSIAGRPLNPRRALEFGIQLADALAEAHAVDIVHRDLRPDNIVVTPKGNAKILDFGLSDWTSGGAARQAAAGGAPTGPAAALAYMSPEQALGERGDQRTDIFSLGTILFEMFTGKAPFGGSGAGDTLVRIVQAVAPAPSTVNPALPRELDAVVAKAMAKSLDARYEAAAALAGELRSVAAVLDVRQSVADEAAPRVAVRPLRRRRVWPFILAGFAMGMAAVLWWLGVIR